MILHEKLTSEIIGAAIEVHRHLGPGLLESAYRVCLCHELEASGVFGSRRNWTCRSCTRASGWTAGTGWTSSWRGSVVVELKAVETVLPVCQAQLITYLRN